MKTVVAFFLGVLATFCTMIAIGCAMSESDVPTASADDEVTLEDGYLTYIGMVETQVNARDAALTEIAQREGMSPVHWKGLEADRARRHALLKRLGVELQSESE